MHAAVLPETETSAPRITLGLTVAQDRATLTRVPALALLAEHLNAALAHGEAILALSLPQEIETGATVPSILRHNQDVAKLARDLHALELAVLSRLLLARQCASTAVRQDKALSLVMHLIHGGTAVVADIAAGITADAAADDNTGSNAPAFLRSRGVVANADRAISEDYLVQGRLHLGTLMDLCAVALDKVDLFLNDAAADARVT
jgi:hypothetical protein